MGQVQSEFSITVMQPVMTSGSSGSSPDGHTDDHYVLIRTAGLSDQLVSKFPARRVLPVDPRDPHDVEILIVKADHSNQFLAHQKKPYAHLVIPHTAIAGIAPKEEKFAEAASSVHFLGFYEGLTLNCSAIDHFNRAQAAALSVDSPKISVLIQWEPAISTRGCAAATAATNTPNDHMFSVLRNADKVIRSMTCGKTLASGPTEHVAQAYVDEIRELREQLAKQKEKHDAELKYLHKIARKSQDAEPFDRTLTSRVTQLSTEAEELLEENERRKEEARNLVLHNRRLQKQCEAAHSAKEAALRLFAETARNSNLMQRISVSPGQVGEA